MASRPILAPFPVITNGDMAGNITSLVTVIQNTSMVSYDISWTGITPVGVMSVQVSNTYSQNADGTVRTPGDWTDVPLSPTPSVSGSPGNGHIEILVIASFAIRLIYTRTSGTGTMQAVINGKVS